MSEQKKSIVINSNYLNTSGGGGGASKSKSSGLYTSKKKRLSEEEIVKPNKLKKMLLERINAKRKAELNVVPYENKTIDVNKESKIFSNEFKKSLEFLDNYINKNPQNNRLKNRTLKKGQEIKTNLELVRKANNVQVIPSKVVQPQVIKPIPLQLNPSIVHQPQPIIVQPAVQKINLQLQPNINKPNYIVKPQVTHSLPKFNLPIGRTENGDLIHTELPPELMPTSPTNRIVIPNNNIITNTVIETIPQVQNSNTIPIMDEVDVIPNEKEELNQISEIKDDEMSTPSSLSSYVSIHDKPYGCLKGGNKPTFRSWNKTIKNPLRFSEDKGNNESERQYKLNELKNKYKRKKIRRIVRKTITRKYKLGKQGNVVGVLIKNNETRKNIQREHGLLKRKSIHDIKKYLIEKNLLKVGSAAPNDVLRKMYEDAILTGEVENVGKGVILHNFLKGI